VTTDLTKLSNTITPLVAAHAASEAAKADELAAQISLVTRILEIARPAARALGTRPSICDQFVVSGGGDSKEARAPWRGIVLSCKSRQIGPSRKKTSVDANDGDYEGEDVFLREDGKLVELSYKGSWSNWQGAHCAWHSVERVISVEEFCRDWDCAAPALLVDHLQTLANEAGDRDKATTKSQERASKYRAILALL
jgi:hypothetical protein